MESLVGSDLWIMAVLVLFVVGMVAIILVFRRIRRKQTSAVRFDPSARRKIFVAMAERLTKTVDEARREVEVWPEEMKRDPNCRASEILADIERMRGELRVLHATTEGPFANMDAERLEQVITSTANSLSRAELLRARIESAKSRFRTPPSGGHDSNAP